MAAKKEIEPLTYKGRPLVRCGDTIYYGNMAEKFVIKLEIKSKKTVLDMEIANRVAIYLMSTNPEISARKQVIKSSEKNGLYLALDIADVWLERALAS